MDAHGYQKAHGRGERQVLNAVMAKFGETPLVRMRSPRKRVRLQQVR